MISEGFHLVVLIVAGSETEAGKEYSRLLLFFDKFDKACFRRSSYVKITVGAKDDTVIAALYEIFLGNIICCNNALGSVGTSAGFKGVNGSLDLFVHISRKTFSKDFRRTRICNDGHSVILGKALLKGLQCILCKRKTVVPEHGT